MCREANLRLRRCAEFLFEGLCGEAVDYAVTQPPVLEMVAALDFRELPDWERTCGTMGLTRPGRLAVEFARDLQEAFKQQQPLREPLAKLRYLALSRAPLPERLAVLRQLIALDPACPVWKRTRRRNWNAAPHRNDPQRSRRRDAGRRRWPPSTSCWPNCRPEPRQTAIPAELKETLARTSAAARIEATCIPTLTCCAPAPARARSLRGHVLRRM